MKSSKVIGIVLTIIILGIFIGCSSKSAEDEMLSLAKQVSSELKDKGNSNYIAFKGGERIIITQMGILTDGINKTKCNKKKLEEIGQVLFIKL